MSFIRLLALSYLAWAAVFVVAMLLVAHLPLPGNAVWGTSAPVARIGTLQARPQADKPDARKVARLELAPVPPIPSSPANDNVTLPQPPLTEEPQPKPELSKQSPPVAVTARPPARPVARLDLAPAPVPVPRPLADVPPPKPHVVSEPKLKPSDKLQPARVATLPKSPSPPAPAHARGRPHLASSQPAFRIPDPPPSSLANLPAHLQPAASRNRKRASVEPAFHIPDPPPLEAPRL